MAHFAQRYQCVEPVTIHIGSTPLAVPPTFLLLSNCEQSLLRLLELTLISLSELTLEIPATFCLKAFLFAGLLALTFIALSELAFKLSVKLFIAEVNSWPLRASRSWPC
jgi:hypothetical protein